jgi:hypothetical protein
MFHLHLDCAAIARQRLKDEGAGPIGRKVIADLG